MGSVWGESVANKGVDWVRVGSFLIRHVGRRGRGFGVGVCGGISGLLPGGYIMGGGNRWVEKCKLLSGWEMELRKKCDGGGRGGRIA